MRNKVCVRSMVLGVVIMLIWLVVGAMVSCGDGITKATDISQVVDAHFKYDDLHNEIVIAQEGNTVWDAYEFVGKITNNSGINIQNANFNINIGHPIDPIANIVINDFVTGSTREFRTIMQPEIYNRAFRDNIDISGWASGITGLSPIIGYEVEYVPHFSKLAKGRFEVPPLI